MFSRTEQLLGTDALNKIRRARVILFGVGGVGGWCAEMLVRTGIEHLTIVDFDNIEPSNINRQIIANSQNIGQPKVFAMQQRLRDINPNAHIHALNVRFCQDTAEHFNFNDFDYVLDAIDSLDDKMLLILRATNAAATLFSAMGAARHRDPNAITTAEFQKVHTCPLARALRQKMKQQQTFPAKKFTCVFSQETPLDSGSYAPAVATAGIQLATLVLNHICKE